MQATVTSKGQITLPKALRDHLHLAPGDRVEFILEENNLVRMVPRTTSVTRLKGMLPKPQRPVSLEEMDQILVTAELTIENEGIAFQALDAYREGSADFSDYLLALVNRAAGCETTYSFDVRLCTHAAARLPD
jgi:antitoxin PrlF